MNLDTLHVDSVVLSWFCLICGLWFHNWVLVIALPVFIGGYYRGVGVHLIDVCRCFFVFDFCLLPLGEILVCICIILFGVEIMGRLIKWLHLCIEFVGSFECFGVLL